MIVDRSHGETNGKAWTMRMKSWHVSILACGISALAWGQQGAELLPKPATSGLTLAETMQVQQTTLNQQGKLSWITRFHDSADGTDWTYAFTAEISNVVADGAACRIAYHYNITRDGTVLGAKDTSFSLHDVEDLTFTTGDLRQNKQDAVAGHTTWSAKVDPPLFDLVVQEQEKAEHYFLFADEDTANRFAKAMGHAVDLCGGSRGSF